MDKEQELVLDRFDFEDGQRLTDVRVGYRAWGKLNDNASNAVLVCHGFPSNSAAWGGASAPTEGWWPWMIGPGKILDTDRHFVVCASSFSNLDASDKVRSTGPASIDPATGKSYAETFPRLAMSDLVRAQNEVLANFGISKLAFAIGPSMGAAQVLTRACRMPETMRAGAAILPYCGGDVLAELSIKSWALALEQKGLSPAFMAVAMDAVGRDALNVRFDGKADAAWAELWTLSEARASVSDPGNFSTLCHALASARLSAPTGETDLPKLLLAPASSDRLFPPSVSDRLAEELSGYGFDVQQALLSSERGHLGGLTDHILHIEPELRAFMAEH